MFVCLSGRYVMLFVAQQRTLTQRPNLYTSGSSQNNKHHGKTY